MNAQGKETVVKHNQLQLIDYLRANDPKKIGPRKDRHNHYDLGVSNVTFTKFHFSGDFGSFIFKKCKFRECTFENIWGFYLFFKDCTFEKCTFKNSRFSHGEFEWSGLTFNDCYFRNVEIDEGDLDNSFFTKCSFMGLSLLGENLFNVHFMDCSIENSQFQSMTYYAAEDDPDAEEAPDVMFANCKIGFSHFISTDFRNSAFVDCSFYLCSFMDCVVNDATFQKLVESKYRSYASLDFQTILKSKLTYTGAIRDYFNIQVGDIKKRIAEISSKVTLKSVFISYSFKDGFFVKPLSDVLEEHGVKCFFWEKDAPGGEYLEEIMSANIRKHDTILFVSSENSLKSKACQFELSEGRKKQEETWKNAFYPIHIDNFLFEVKQSQIRPVDKQQEYWENIQELRRTNSKDFSALANGKMDLSKLEQEVVGTLLKDLKLG